MHAGPQRKHFKGGQAKSEQYYLDSHLHRPGSTLAIEKHGHADLKNLVRPWPGQPGRFRWHEMPSSSFTVSLLDNRSQITVSLLDNRSQKRKARRERRELGLSHSQKGLRIFAGSPQETIAHCC